MPLRRLFVIATALALLIGLWCAGWFYAAHHARARIAAWAAAQQAAGNVVAYDTLEIGGFPFHVVVAITGPAYGTPTYRWQAASLALAFQPWNPSRFGFRMAGAQRLDVVTGNAAQTVELTMERADGTGSVDSAGDISAFESEFSMLSVAVEQGPTYGFGNLRIEGRVPANPIPRPDATSLELAFAADQIALPADQAILGSRIERAAGTIAFNGRLTDQPLIPALAAWRDAGGTIDLSRVSLRWGALSVEGDGTVALDQALQPLAASSLQISGFNETLDRLAVAGAIRPDAAAATKFALGLIAKSPAGGGPPVASVPVSIQSQQLFVGPIAVSQLRPIRWE